MPLFEIAFVCVPLSRKTYLFGRRMHVNSHRAGGGRNRPHPVTRHRNTGGCSERVAHFFCGLHDPLWLCRSHYVLARISRKSRRAECEREHDTCASNRRTAQATKPVSYSHAVNVIPFRICASLFRDYSRQRSDSFSLANYSSTSLWMRSFSCVVSIGSTERAY